MSNSLYSLKVEASVSHMLSLADEKDDEDRTELDDSQTAIEFSAGNPRVEHILGTVHLYRHVPPRAPQRPAGQQGEASSASRDKSHQQPIASASQQLQGAWASQQLQGAWARAAGRPASMVQKQGQEGEITRTSQKEATQHLTDLLCCLATPADMSVAEFCTFCGAYLENIRHMRVLRREAEHKVVCMVLIQFTSPEQASAFHRDFNNKAFSSLEPNILCRLVHVKEVEIRNGMDVTRVCSRVASSTAETEVAQAGSSEGGSTSCNATQTELPTCPVCLERLDEEISGIVTTVCNHRFHSECLQKWGDTSCPVCRYCSLPSAHNSSCNTCGTTTDLWICLICGHVGCGRYREGHAVDHWKVSSHCFSLELETQTVWDYAGDNYVHRLIQSKTDGKLVEVPSPRVSSSHLHRPGDSGCSLLGRGGSRGGLRRGSSGHEASCHAISEHQDGVSYADYGSDGGDDDELKEAMVASKLDHVAAEYNHLLATQLDSQRQYFETLLAQARADGVERCQEMAEGASNAAQSAKQSEQAAKEADRKKTTAEKKLADTSAALAQARKETSFLKSLGDSLLANQKDFQEQLKVVRAESAAKGETIKDLQEQVRDLMVYIEAGRAIAGGSDVSEIRDATILPMPEEKAETSKKTRKKKK